MKLRTTVTLALTFTAGLLLPGMAQDRPASRMTAERSTPQIPPSNNLHLPSSPILPMTNPIAPMMTAPVQPFVRYQGPAGTPTVVVPPEKAHVGDKRRGRDNFDGPAVIYVPYIPYEYPYYDTPLAVPPTTPGYLPGMDPGRLPPVSEPPLPAPAPIPAAVAPEAPRSPETNIAITPEKPPLVVEPPALGTTRTQTIVRYGEPWGRVTLRGRDTLYFNGGLVLVFENDRVVEIR